MPNIYIDNDDELGFRWSTAPFDPSIGAVSVHATEDEIRSLEFLDRCQDDRDSLISKLRHRQELTEGHRGLEEFVWADSVSGAIEVYRTSPFRCYMSRAGALRQYQSGYGDKLYRIEVKAYECESRGHRMGPAGSL